MKQNSQVSEIQISYNPNFSEKLKIENSRQTYELILNDWDENTLQMQEEVKLLLLNRNNQILGVFQLAKGGLTACVVDVRIILSVALKSLATGLILVHNHPSGNLKPSNEDIKITNRLKEACKLLEIVLLDHLIITKDSYLSFTDEGIL